MFICLNTTGNMSKGPNCQVEVSLDSDHNIYNYETDPPREEW